MNAVAADQPSEPVEEFPGLDLAYERAMSSYQDIAQRHDAANHRIDGLLTLTSTLTLAAPLIVAATGTETDFRSPSLVAAALLFVVVLLIGVVARGFVGGVTLMAPTDLYQEWLDLSPIDFKLSGVYWAGQHFDQTASVIWRKAWAAHIMTALFVAESLMLLAWVGSEL